MCVGTPENEKMIDTSKCFAQIAQKKIAPHWLIMRICKIKLHK